MPLDLLFYGFWSAQEGERPGSEIGFKHGPAYINRFKPGYIYRDEARVLIDGLPIDLAVAGDDETFHKVRNRYIFTVHHRRAVHQPHFCDMEAGLGSTVLTQQ